MIGTSVKSICKKFFGLNANYVGYIEYDSFISKCINKRQSYMRAYPASRCAKEIERLTEALDRDIERERKEERVEAPTLMAYSIKQSDPKTVLQVLQTLLAGQPDVRLDLDTTTNKIIVLARKAEHATVKATIEQLESSE